MLRLRFVSIGSAKSDLNLSAILTMISIYNS